MKAADGGQGRNKQKTGFIQMVSNKTKNVVFFRALKKTKALKKTNNVFFRVPAELCLGETQGRESLRLFTRQRTFKIRPKRHISEPDDTSDHRTYI